MRALAVILATPFGFAGGLVSGFVVALAIPGPNTLLIVLWALAGGWVAGYGTAAFTTPRRGQAA